jgi:hypothetical protein
MITPHAQCCCPDCVAIRRAFVARTHPLLRAKAEEPGPSLIPADQALAMRLEDREELRQRLASLEAEIKILRDCAGAQA